MTPYLSYILGLDMPPGGPLTDFFMGMVATLCWMAGIFFLRFYTKVADRFFLLFAIAFWLFAIERVALVLEIAPREMSASIYLIRLSGFLIILFAIVQKNKPGRA